MKEYSTREAARKLRISFASINRYIAQKKIPFPPLIEIGSTSARLWTEKDIERVRALLPKIANGRKIRYKRKHSALSNQHSVKATSKTRASSKPAQARAPVVPKSEQRKKN